MVYESSTDWASIIFDFFGKLGNVTPNFWLFCILALAFLAGVIFVFRIFYNIIGFEGFFEKIS